MSQACVVTSSVAPGNPFLTDVNLVVICCPSKPLVFTQEYVQEHGFGCTGGEHSDPLCKEHTLPAPLQR